MSSDKSSPKPSTQVAPVSRVRRGQKNVGASAKASSAPTSTGNPVGRPTSLVEPTRSVILRAIERGCPYSFACGVAGVSCSTFYDWQRKGRVEQAAGLESEFTLFLDDIKRARATFVVEALERINLAGRQQWQAAAWTLERLFPEHFASDRLELRRIVKEMAELQKKLAEMQSQSAGKPTLKVVG